MSLLTNNINQTMLIRRIDQLRYENKLLKARLIECSKGTDKEEDDEEQGGGSGGDNTGGGSGGVSPPAGEKLLKNVLFTNGSVSSGIWTYTIISDTYTVSAALNINALTETFGKESVTLGYADMPYEKLISRDKTEFLTVSYKDAFKKLPSGVTKLAINNWTNGNITDMSSMFYGCGALTTLDLSGFNMTNVESMDLMFYECYSMTKLTGINEWNTGKVLTLNNTFGRCMALIELDLSGWNLSAITDAYNMFTSCDSLEAIYVNESVYETFIPIRFDTGIVFAEWFHGDKPLVPTLRWDQIVSSSDDTTIMITAFSSIVYNCTFDELKSSTPPYFINGIYRYRVVECPANSDKRVIGVVLDDRTIDRLDIPESVSPGAFVMDSKNTLLPVLIFDNMFSFAESLEYVDVSKWKTSNVVDMSNLFSGCKALMDIKGLGEWKTSNVVDMSSMFAGCSILQSISLPNWVLKDGINLDSMFASCNGLIILTVPLNIAKQFYNLSTTIRLTFNTWYYGDTQLSNDVLDSISSIPSTVVTFTKDRATVLYYDSAFPTGDTSFTKGEWQYKIYKSTLYDDDSDSKTPPVYRPAFIEARLTTEAIYAGMTPSGLPASIITDADYASLPVVSMKQAFMGSNATSIVANGWNTYFINDMSGMFMNCMVLKSATLRGLVKSNVSNLYAMFALCMSLEALDLSDWTVDITDDEKIKDIFTGCTALTRVKLSKSGARLLSKLPAPADGGSWRVVRNRTQTNLTNLEWNNDWGEGPMQFVSYPISADKTLTGVTFTSNAYTSGMWTYTLGDDGISLSINEAGLPEISNNTLTLTEEHMPCEKLVMTDGTTTYVTVSYKDVFEELPDTVKTLTIDGWNNRTINTMEDIFGTYKALTSLALNNFDTFGVENMKTMFNGCEKLTSLSLGDKFDTSLVTDMSGMFNGCEKLTSLDLGGKFDTSNVTNMNTMFYGCKALTELILGEKFNTHLVTNMAGVFGGCEKLVSLDLGDKFDTHLVTDMRSMFSGCKALMSLDLGDEFNTSNVTNMSSMFSGCEKLTSLILGYGFDTSKVAIDGILEMFNGCKALNSIALYKASNSIIKMLPSATWTVKDSTSKDVGTVAIVQGTSATWDPLDLPDQWEDDAQWTLSRTIQQQ